MIEASQPGYMDMFVDTLRTQIAAEVKSEITTDIIDRIVRIITRGMQNLEIKPTITVTPNLGHIQVDIPPAPSVDVELNVDDLVAELRATRQCLMDCTMLMTTPTQKDIIRDERGLVKTIIERHING